MVMTSGILLPLAVSVEADSGDEEAGRRAARLDRHLDRGGYVQVRGQEAANLGGGCACRMSAARRLVQVRKPGGGSVEGRVAVLPVLGPGTVQDHQPDGGGRMGPEKIADQYQVPERLGH